MGIPVQKLRIPAHNEEVMKHWDAWRAYIKNGGAASWPRDAFEVLLDELDNERSFAADEIERLRADIQLLRSGLRFALGEAKRTPFNGDEYDAASALLERP